MAFPTIARMTDRNLVGLCHIDVVQVDQIATWPDELNGNLVGDIVLVEGASWSRVYLEDDTGALFLERWQLVGGAQHSDAGITGDVAKDRLSLMPEFWRMKGRRYVARMTTRNGDVLVLGTKTEPATALVSTRTAGQDVDSDRNQYSIAFAVRRRHPVPWYQGVVEEPTTPPEDCPTVGELVAPLSWAEIAALLDAEQLADAEAAICETPPDPVLCDVIDAALTGTGPAGITLTSGANEDFLPQTGTSGGKPQYFLVNFDGTGFSAEANWTGSNWYMTDGVNEWTSAEDVATPGDVVTWTGDTPLPTVVTSGPVSPAILLDCLTTEQNDELFGAMVDARTWAEIQAELDGTQLAAAEAAICEVPEDVTIQLQDTDGADIGAPDVYTPGTITTKTAPDGTVDVIDHLGETLGSTTVKSNGTATVVVSDWEGEFPVITENTPSYNNEGDNTTGWTTTNATVAVASGIFRASQTAAGTPGSAQVSVTQPVTGKDWVIYCRARSFGVGGAQLLRLKGTGTQEVIVYFNFNAVTGSQQAGTMSLRATTAGGVTSNMNVGTGLTFNSNWTDYALRYDSKNLAFGLFIRETNGWRLGAQVNGTSFAASIELLFNATAGNAWYEFEFLTLVAPNFQSIGDSLTRGSTLYSPIIASALTDSTSTWQRYANVYPSLRNNLVVNKGVGGDTSALIDGRIQVDVLNNQPKLVFLSAPANDYGSVTLAQRTTNIQAAINKCAAASVPVILHSSSYATSAYTLSAQPAHRDYYREWWKDYRPTLTGVQGSVNVMGGLKDPADYLDVALSQSDNIHPTPTGYYRMGQWIGALPYA